MVRPGCRERHARGRVPRPCTWRGIREKRINTTLHNKEQRLQPPEYTPTPDWKLYAFVATDALFLLQASVFLRGGECGSIGEGKGWEESGRVGRLWWMCGLEGKEDYAWSVELYT